MGYVLEIHQNNEVYTVEVGQLNVIISADSGSSVQSDLVAHKNATNPHNITPAGIGALSVVAHDSSLSGNGTNESPLVVDNVVLDYTTTNVITSLTLTQDKNGNPLNLVNFDIIISGENVDTLNNCNMILNNNNTAIYYNGVTLSTNSVIYLYLRGQQDKRFQGQVMFRKINNTYYFFQITNDTTVTGTMRSNSYGGRVITDIGNVTRIYFTTINWKVGTNIKIMRV